ncbi:hypothetical protein G6F57_023456 [Rhizopus arrhizus]|nr:hypothetical protein G6F57_023456 [Rhizopus arrhizus]
MDELVVPMIGLEEPIDLADPSYEGIPDQYPLATRNSSQLRVTLAWSFEHFYEASQIVEPEAIRFHHGWG